jgi:hypothetical protein
MGSGRVPHTLPFESWKEGLHNDCQKQGNLAAYDALGEFVLRFLWETGVEPTVQAIVASDAEPPKNET